MKAQRAEGRGQRAWRIASNRDDRDQRTDDRSQMAEVRRPMAEIKGQKIATSCP